MPEAAVTLRVDRTAAAQPRQSPRLVPPGGRRIPAEVWDAAVEARRWRDASLREGAEIVARAQAEADELRAASARDGREEGHASAAGAIVQAALERDRLLAGARAALVDLAFAVAGRVVAAVAEGDRSVVVEVAGRALDEARAPCVTVRAHAADLEALREAAPQLAAPDRALRLVADPAVGRGGVIVESDSCRVDARLEVQIALLRRALDECDGGSR